MTHYNKKFYREQRDGSYLSAKEVFPQIFKYINPKSVIDIGCGVGTWLSVLETEYKVNDILGVDGDYVNKQSLMIDNSKFCSYDLKNYYKSSRKFDLAMSLEVGEHIPENCADNLVKTLTDASDMVFFSAAIPGQSGTFHINEQFPEYWAKKFIERGFTPIDFLRKAIWNNETIDLWYKQNIIFYVKNEKVNSLHPDLISYAKITDPAFLTRIHPDLLNYLNSKLKQVKSLIGFIRFHLYPLKKMFKK